MTEYVSNLFQLITTALCTVIAARRWILSRRKAWLMLSYASGAFFLGVLYWQIYLIVRGNTPPYSYIPYLSWYASYLFLLLLLFNLRNGYSKPPRNRRVLWVFPFFSIGMCVLYLHWGDWAGNIITAILMSLLMRHAAEGLLSLVDNHSMKEKKWIYMTILSFCLLEYAVWTSSCFWIGNAWYNPYFWFDALLSVIFLLFPFSLRKAIGT